MTRGKRAPQAEPPRPVCACGKPGTCRVSIEVMELALERDAGMSARPYWRAAFHTGTKIETTMCNDCMKANVSISIGATASVAGKQTKP